MNGLPSAFTRRRFTQLAAITVGTLALGACASETNNAPVSSSNEASDDEASIGEQKTDQSFDQQEGHQNEADTPADPAEQARAIAKERVQNMSLAQKVAQLFVVAPEALVPEALVEGVSPVTQAAEIGQAMVVDYPVGGFVYFAPNIVSPDQTTSLLSGTSQLFAESENVLPLQAMRRLGFKMLETPQTLGHATMLLQRNKQPNLLRSTLLRLALIAISHQSLMWLTHLYLTRCCCVRFQATLPWRQRWCVLR